MILPFDEIPDDAKLFIFPSSRKFYEIELLEINSLVTAFLNKWESDEIPFNCSYEIRYDRFIIIVVDVSITPLSLENHDALISLILQIEQKYEVLLLDKINVCYKQGEYVQYKELKEFKLLIKNNSVSKNTIVFNTMLNTKEELEFDWEINIMDSWLGRLL
ncbi:ABC transporter ATPase [Lutibacter sp.]|uniref:ABC transporter ATPase n=1 Tax=Lutibacter sp. TaxID=1925666 RepID=UPI0027334A64|nr:ABC transporter ATPase [Lutibacter sp.]MDP3313643.1 ABC transporter ATPase [Lutibacter sp.]